MQLLETWKSYLVSAGRVVAMELCKKKGSTNTLEVRKEMERRDLLVGYTGKNHWTGAIFNQSKVFEHTGDFISYSDPDRNIHEREIRVWQLKDPEVSIPTLPQRPDPLRPSRTPVEQAHSLALSMWEQEDDPRLKGKLKRLVTLLVGEIQ